MSVGLIPACAFRNINIKQDTRLEIISPKERSTVRFPFLIRWHVSDFQVIPPDGSRRTDTGYFALFFDRSPMPPGRDLRWVAENDEPCLMTPGCPDEEYLNRVLVYTTSTAFLEVQALPDTRPIERPRADDLHEVTIVLLNGAGERIGESAFSIKFIVERLQVTGSKPPLGLEKRT